METIIACPQFNQLHLIRPKNINFSYSDEFKAWESSPLVDLTRPEKAAGELLIFTTYRSTE